jgi:hypothetical protein
MIKTKQQMIFPLQKIKGWTLPRVWVKPLKLVLAKLYLMAKRDKFLQSILSKWLVLRKKVKMRG